MKKLTHLDRKGNVKMVDISAKPVSKREATASCTVSTKKETLRLIRYGGMPKGDVFATARIAGIMAAKKTSDFIPLTHPINLTSVHIDIKPDTEKNLICIKSTVATNGQTGVEMEALTAVAGAALAIYDMCKAVDRGMVISDIMLLEKKGGKSGEYKRGKE